MEVWTKVPKEEMRHLLQYKAEFSRWLAQEVNVSREVQRAIDVRKHVGMFDLTDVRTTKPMSLGMYFGRSLTRESDCVHAMVHCLRVHACMYAPICMRAQACVYLYVCASLRVCDGTCAACIYPRATRVLFLCLEQKMPSCTHVCRCKCAFVPVSYKNCACSLCI